MIRVLTIDYTEHGQWSAGESATTLTFRGREGGQRLLLDDSHLAVEIPNW